MSPDTHYAARTVKKNGVKRTVILHREIMGVAKHERVDHVNGRGWDDRISNLRLATPTQNAGNSRKRHVRTSIYKGVYWNRNAGKWMAQIKKGVKRNSSGYLGLFTIEADAARAYDRAARERFVGFACQNFPRRGEQSVHG